MPVRIVKLGGSLLSWRDVAKVFHQWLIQQPSMRTLVVVGGGAPVQRLRRMRCLGPVTAHWRAIEHMDDNAKKFAKRADIPIWGSDLTELVAALGQPKALRGSTWIMTSARRIVQQLEAWPGIAPLPRSWAVTSDSIAAQVGSALGCRDLALLKSCDVPLDFDLWQLAKAGIVDGHFPLAAARLSVRLVNLRRFT